MIPAAFDYRRAGSVEEAVELLGSDADAKVLAGGHSLIPLMRLRFARPSLLVDIGRVDDLRYVREDGDRIAIGALTSFARLARDPILTQRFATMAFAAAHVGDPQVRHRGTIGGSIAHGDPASDLATILLAVDADLVVHGLAGERTIPVREFCTGMFTTALGPQDVLAEIRVPAVSHGTYLKFTRRSQDWATVGVAAVRVGNKVQVGLTSMGATPLRALGVEAAAAAGASPAEAAERAADGTAPTSDVSGSADYRADLARILVRRALEELESTEA
jgi:aerobic carbon-monoxide dehydrogenase medium subunit